MTGLAVKNATVHTVTGGTVRRGTVLVSGGRIEAAGQEVPVPSGYRVIQGAGKHLFPGFIDAHCHVGNFGEGSGGINYDGNEATSPTTPAIRAIDGINPHDPAFEDARRYAVTTLCILPGSANVIGGMGCVVKPRGVIIDRMVVRDARPGLKAAFGENPKRVYGDQKKCPGTRMGTALVLREAWVKALTYRDKTRKDPEKAPDRSLEMEALLEVLEGRQPLRCHAHSAFDMATAVRIAREFGYEITLEHTTEGHLITDFLKEQGIRCQVGPGPTHRSKVELRELSFTTPGILAAAGIPVSISTDAPVIPVQYLPNCAGWAIRDGMREEDALAAVTIRPAEVLGIAHRVGSIEPGKDADLGLWTGMPWDSSARCVLTMIDGEIVWEASKRN